MDPSLVLALGLWTADYGQTRSIPSHPQFYETNPIIGKHPNEGRINTYFALGYAVIPFLHYQLGNKYTFVVVAMEANTVRHNAKLGIKFNF